MNLTLQTVEETVIPTSALAVIVVPVYGGHVAPLAMERLESIRGLDTPAVLVVVYGNRAYEKALMELDVFAIPHGLKVIAGATFIGEHSYSTDKCPIADGRPNESDLDYAEDFGKKIMEKIQAAARTRYSLSGGCACHQTAQSAVLPLIPFFEEGNQAAQKRYSASPYSLDRRRELVYSLWYLCGSLSGRSDHQRGRTEHGRRKMYQMLCLCESVCKESQEI